MTNQTLNRIREDAERLEQESITLDLCGEKEKALSRAETALFEMETVAKSRKQTEDYTRLVSYCWNYLVIIHYPGARDGISDLVARKAMYAQEQVYAISRSSNDKGNLAEIYRDVCTFLDSGSLETAQKSVVLSEELVRDQQSAENYKRMGTCYSKLGLVLLAKKDFINAKNYLNRSIEILRQTDRSKPWNCIELIRACIHRALYFALQKSHQHAQEEIYYCIEELSQCYATCKDKSCYPSLFLTSCALIRFCEFFHYPERSAKCIELAVTIYNDDPDKEQFLVNRQEVLFVREEYTKLLADQLSELGKEQMSSGEWRDAKDLFHLEFLLRKDLSPDNQEIEEQKKLITSVAHMAKANKKIQ